LFLLGAPLRESRDQWAGKCVRSAPLGQGKNEPLVLVDSPASVLHNQDMKNTAQTTGNATYNDILYGWQKERLEEVAMFRATWPNGNEPDGETMITIDILGGETEDGQIGYILLCDDNGNGGSQSEAGENVYPTKEAAIEAAKKYAADHADHDE
jgi:hypothetical protein